MKKYLFFLWIVFSGSGSVYGQIFSASLTGNPMNTAGWTAATVSSVSGNEFVLTDPVGNQAGYIYYSTPQNLTVCARFTVEFEFRISNSSSPTADGLAFWYVTNPPTGFISGGGLGLPNNPNGLLLLFDTYDNNSTPDNPIVALRAYNGTRNYEEGSATGRLGTDLFNQTWVRDGAWHKCTLIYEGGLVTVFLNGSATPSIAAYYPLNHTGYFGFSASTGSSWARHAIREVYIDGAPLPPAPAVVSPVVYCQYDEADTLTAVGDDLHWYTTDTGTIPLPGPPVPDTDVPGVTTWYVAAGGPGACEGYRDSIQVTVYPLPEMPEMEYRPTYCAGEAFVPFQNSGRQLIWYDADAGGYGTPDLPTVNTSVPGVYTWYVSQRRNGCEGSRTPVTITVHDSAVADFTYDADLRCSRDVISFTNTSQGASSWMWSFGDGSTGKDEHPVHVYHRQGVYDVALKAYTPEGCVDSVIRSIDTRREIIPLRLQVSPDTMIKYGESVQLHVAGAGYYSWSPPGSLDRSDVADPVATPKEPTVYTVTGLDEDGCSGTATIRVDVDYSMQEALPNAFTPNGDGVNDRFRLLQVNHQKLISFNIFNRWGQEIFSTTDPAHGWDGTLNGTPQPIGTYIYVIQLVYPDGQSRTLQGTVALVR